MRALTLLPVLILTLSTGQLSAQVETKDCIADLNHDGIIDTLDFTSDYDKLVSFTDGRSGEKTSVPREEYCRCQIRSVTPIPPVLWLPENVDVLALIKAGLWPQERAEPDPSFAWILRGLENRREIKKHPHFDLVIDPGLVCEPGNVELPSTYSVLLGSKVFQHSLTGHYYMKVTTDRGYATYYGHNHYQRRDPRADSVVLVATTTDFEIYRTSHGLYAQSPTDYHWLFVTDHALTGAPDKLRWASIGDVAVWQDRLLLLQHRLPVSGGTAVFLIDLDTGRTARLRPYMVGEPDDRISFMIKGDSLAIKATPPGNEEKTEVDLVFPLMTLLEEMTRL